MARTKKASPKTEVVRGFHILQSDKRGRPRFCYGDKRRPRVGVWMGARHKGKRVKEPKLCAPGMHACSTVTGALRLYTSLYDRWLCLVEVRGDIKRGYGTKFVGRARRILSMVKIDHRILARYKGNWTRHGVMLCGEPNFDAIMRDFLRDEIGWMIPRAKRKKF